MIALAITGALYFVTIGILQQNKPDLTEILDKISIILHQNSTKINILHTFKVTGERTVIAVINVSNNVILDSFLHRIHSVGQLDIVCQPVITYENFGRNLGLSDDLTQPSAVILKPDDSLYWINMRVDYFGNKTSELLNIWKITAARLFRNIKNGDIRAIVYKNMGEREVQVLMHVADRELLDMDVFNCPLTLNFGSNIGFESKGLIFLDQYKGNN